jgi:hypothetical protein
MAFFRDPFNGIDRSPSRSVYGINSSGEIIVPIDFVVLTLTSGNFYKFDDQLPSQLTGATVRLNGASVIGSITETENPNSISVDPVVKLTNNGINFSIIPAISSGDILFPNESIIFTNSSGTISGGTLTNPLAQSGLSYLDGNFMVDAFLVNFPSFPSSIDIGSMVILPRLGKSLGMLLGPSLGSPIVYPAYNIT